MSEARTSVRQVTPCRFRLSRSVLSRGQERRAAVGWGAVA
jgi:hypothetical protein